RWRGYGARGSSAGRLWRGRRRGHPGRSGGALPGGGNTPRGGVPRGRASAGLATPTAAPSGAATITVRSPAFAAGAMIPVRFSCRGSNTPIPLTWTGVPASAASVALIMDDPDAPSGTFTHWVVFNLPVTTRGITNGR